MKAKAGQAIAEFVVGLVAILILTAALLQIGTLIREDSRTIQEARAEAGIAALSDTYFAPVSPGPRYIQNWSTGPDRAAYTRDDQAILGNADLLAGGIIPYARPDSLASFLPDNSLSPLADSSQVLSGLSFVRGYSSSGPVPLFPITRKLIFGRDTLTVESSAFLIYTKGLE
jgi:hypothetical protein